MYTILYYKIPCNYTFSIRVHFTQLLFVFSKNREKKIAKKKSTHVHRSRRRILVNYSYKFCRNTARSNRVSEKRRNDRVIGQNGNRTTNKAGEGSARRHRCTCNPRRTRGGRGTSSNLRVRNSRQADPRNSDQEIPAQRES